MKLTWVGAAGLLSICGIACGAGRSDSQTPPPNGRYVAGVPGPNGRAERFRPRSQRQAGSAYLFLPGSAKQQLVRYEIVDGMTVVEGDMLLGPAMTVPLRYGIPWAPVSNVHSAVALSNRSHLWPRGDIPYVIAPNVTPDIVGAIGRSIDKINQTELKVHPRTVESDYLVFTTEGSGCSSYVGRIGGPQAVTVEDCGEGSIAHELLHAAGFFHEQSRGDRDDFITIVWNEIAPGAESEFEKRDDSGQDIGAYDYASIMHYGARAFSRSGNPTIITKVPGAVIGQREGLSAGDKAAVTMLYGASAGPIPSIPTGGLPFPVPAGLPTSFPNPFPPTTPGQPTNQGCAGGQVKDVVFQTCSAPCQSGSAPFAGVCTPGGAPTPNTPASCPSGQSADVLTAQCAASCPSGAPRVGGQCWP